MKILWYAQAFSELVLMLEYCLLFHFNALLLLYWFLLSYIFCKPLGESFGIKEQNIRFLKWNQSRMYGCLFQTKLQSHFLPIEWGHWSGAHSVIPTGPSPLPPKFLEGPDVWPRLIVTVQHHQGMLSEFIREGWPFSPASVRWLGAAKQNTEWISVTK